MADFLPVGNAEMGMGYMRRKTTKCLMLVLTVLVSGIITGCNVAEDTNPAKGTYSEDKWLSPEKRMQCVEATVAGDRAALERLLTHYYVCGKDEKQLRFWVEFGVKQDDKYARELQDWLKKQDR